MAGDRSRRASLEVVECILERCGHLEALVTPQRLRRFASAAAAKLTSVSVVLENLWDAHNVSAVIRSAEALGVDAVHVVESPYTFRGNRAILRGADRWVRLHKHPDVAGCLDSLAAAGVVTCAADVGPGCVDLPDVPVDRPLAIVLGTERHGLSVEAKSLTNLRYTVPMQGLTESFNVSVSAAISLYELTARRREHMGAVSDLQLDDMVRRVDRWVRLSRGELS